MNKLFMKWKKDLIPVSLSLDEDGKKIAKPYKWKNGETYSGKIRTNSIGLRTGMSTANVIDVDTKDFGQLTEPFKSWVEDRMMLEDTLIVESANGFHFYVNTGDFKLRTTTKTGANQSEIPFIDFRGEGGMIFIHSNADGISYKVISDVEPMQVESDLIAYLPQWMEAIETVEDREGFENLDDTEDTTKTVMTEYGGLKSGYEIQELLEPISSECNRDTWMQLLASAYNLSEDKKEAKEVCQTWSEKAENFTQRGFDDVWRQLTHGGYGKPFKGGMLVKMHNDIKAKAKEVESKGKFTDYVNKIRNSKSVDEIKDLFDDTWKSAPICSEAQQKALPAICKTRANELEKIDGSGIKYSVDEFKPLIFVEEEAEPMEDLTGFKSYHFDNKFHIVKGDKLKGDVTKQSLYTTGSGLGYKGKEFENFVVTKAKLIQGIKHETDYLIEEEVKYSLKPSLNPSEFKYLHVLTNPLSKDIAYPERQDIIDDFCNNIWKGKAEEAVRLVGLTIRFGETKLNKIHLVAPSNTGKALANSERVLTSNGFKKAVNINMDDMLIGADGRPTKLKGIFPQEYRRKIYKVTFVDGTTVRCDGEHIWSVRTRDNKKFQDVTVNEMLERGVKTSHNANRFFIPHSPECKYGLDGGINIDPYLMGLLLGDGGFTTTTIKFSNKDINLINEVEKRLPDDCKIGVKEFRGGCWNISIVSKITSHSGNSLTKYLKKIRLTGKKSKEKFIPTAYKKASLNSRKQIIQGLIDTDGYVLNDTLDEYSTSSKKLADDFIEVGRSVGMHLSMKARNTKYTKGGNTFECGVGYRIRELKSKHKAIISIEADGWENARCFSVESEDALFVTNGYNLTHNTTMFENIGFQTIHMKRLVQALNADKGIGKNVIDGLKSSGFLLIDEANDPLTQDIKNIDNYIQLDQFGQGGTQDIKLHYTILTSTHKQAIRNMSDEMYNRLLVIELGKHEPQYALDKSTLFINENEVYSKTLTQYFKWLLKDALVNPKYKKADLIRLQDKYRLELNNDVNDMMFEISERVIDNLRTQASTYGDVLEKQGEYYIKRKKDLVGMIDDLLSEHGNVDIGKYSELLVSHFMPDNKAKSIKIDGKPIKYYPLRLKPYYANEQDAIIDEFEDLDSF